MRILWLTTCALAVLLPIGKKARGGEDLSAEREILRAAYAGSLAELATWCDGQGQREAGELTRDWLAPREACQLVIWDIPATRQPVRTLIESNAPSLDEWAARWESLRSVQADALFELARKAARQKHPQLAYELVNEALRENPNHKAARRVAGYVSSDGVWRTPYEAQQHKAGMVWDDRYGWLKKAHLERYAGGERLHQKRWVSAEADAEAHREIRRGWTIETEHYRVTTNDSLEAGVELAARLERLYRAWRLSFFSYATGGDELARAFDGKGTRWRDAGKHQVVYFRDRQEYVAALRPQQPQIDITLGIYFDQSQTAYFFAGKEQDAGTLFHEAAHQLFHETRRVAPHVAKNDNFWVVEAVACYFESLAEREGYVTLGGTSAGRMPAARHRLLDDDFFVPLSRLVRYGMDQWQHDPQIAPLYSQSAGLAAFLIHGQDGRYREPLVAYLIDVYSGKATEDSLAKYAGVPLDQLDREYRQFLSTAGGL